MSAIEVLKELREEYISRNGIPQGERFVLVIDKALLDLEQKEKALEYINHYLNKWQKEIKENYSLRNVEIKNNPVYYHKSHAYQFHVDKINHYEILYNLFSNLKDMLKGESVEK